MGAVAWASWQRSVSHPRSSNRSADLRHPALRLVSPMIQTAAKIDAITNGRNAEWSLAFPIRLRNHHPPHRIGPIRLRDQFLAQACKPLLQTRCFDRREGYSVHSRRSRIGAGQRIGMAQDVFPVNLVVEQVEAERRLGLRLTIQLSLKGLDRYRCCQAHRQSPSPHHLRKHTRSQGPLLNWHCPASTLVRPCPTPARTAACRDVEVATLAHDGSPSITRTTFPTCRAHYPGGSSRCMRRFTSPLTRPSPNGRRVGIRIVTFEACSGFTRVTARRIAQPPKATFVTRLQPSQLPGQAARQLPDQSTTLRVESSSTDDSRLRGALPIADICTASKKHRYSITSSAPGRPTMFAMRMAVHRAGSSRRPSPPHRTLRRRTDRCSADRHAPPHAYPDRTRHGRGSLSRAVRTIVIPARGRRRSPARNSRSPRRSVRGG